MSEMIRLLDSNEILEVSGGNPLLVAIGNGIAQANAFVLANMPAINVAVAAAAGSAQYNRLQNTWHAVQNAAQAASSAASRAYDNALNDFSVAVDGWMRENGFLPSYR